MRHASSLSHTRFTSALFGLVLIASVGCDGASPPPVAVARPGCTHNAAYWRDNVTAWRHIELRMGSTFYAQEEQLDILRTRPNGNGLISLSQELIAATLNVESGAAADGLAETFAAADALIGQLVVPPRGQGVLSPTDTAKVTHQLAAFNDGEVGPGACTATTP